MYYQWLVYDPENNLYCYILRNAIPPELSKLMYEDCTANCYKHYPITMYGKELIQPRCSCVFADQGITG